MSFVVPSALGTTVEAEPCGLARLPDTVRRAGKRVGFGCRGAVRARRSNGVGGARARSRRPRPGPEGRLGSAGGRAGGRRAAGMGRPGTVLIYDSRRLELTNALLLERCDPGTPLSAVRPEIEQDGSSPACSPGCGRHPRRGLRSAHFGRCVRHGSQNSTSGWPLCLPVPRRSIRAWHGRVRNCSGSSPTPPREKCCCH